MRYTAKSLKSLAAQKRVLQNLDPDLRKGLFENKNKYLSSQILKDLKKRVSSQYFDLKIVKDYKGVLGYLAIFKNYSFSLTLNRKFGSIDIKRRYFKGDKIWAFTSPESVQKAGLGVAEMVELSKNQAA